MLYFDIRRGNIGTVFALTAVLTTHCVGDGDGTPDNQPIEQTANGLQADRDGNHQNDRCELQYLTSVWSSGGQALTVYTRVWCYLPSGEFIPRVRVTMTDPDRGIYDAETNTCPARTEVYRGPWGLYQPVAFDAERPGLHGVTLQIENADTGEALGGERILYLLSQLTVPRGVALGPQRIEGAPDTTILNWLGSITDEFLQRCADGDASCAINHALIGFCVLAPEACPKAVGISAGYGVLLESLASFVENDSHIRPEARPVARLILSEERARNSVTGVFKFGGILTAGESPELETFASRISGDDSLRRLISEQEALGWFGWNVDGALTEVRSLGTNFQALVIRATRENALESNTCLSEEAVTRDDLALVVIVNTANDNSSCTPAWDCSAWSDCSCADVKTRTCTDANGCETVTSPPILTLPCTTCGNHACDCGETCTSCPADCGTCPPPVCTPRWNCSAWSSCSCSGVNTRTCTDANGCGTTSGRPALTSALCSACGNGSCDCGETCNSCPADCGLCGLECREYDLTLNAATPVLTDTGINTTGATRVVINVSGRVVFAPGGVTQDANGSSQYGGGLDCTDWSRNCLAGCGSLQFRAVVGTFGSGPLFVVGSHFEGASTSPGNLYLVLNDCGFTDNSGAFSVHVSVCGELPPGGDGGSCPDPNYPNFCDNTCWHCDAGSTLCCPATGTPDRCCGAGYVCQNDGTCCTPTPEVCDGVDNNCNGVADEGCSGSSGPICGNGVCEAGEDCPWCSDCACPPPSCVCSPWETSSCITDCGSSTGVRTCQEDCTWGDACAATAEVCNAQDDDCDGIVDDGLVCGGADGTCIGIWPWTNCECNPTTFGATTRCVDSRYYEGCNNGIWRRDEDCLSYCLEIGRRTGSCIFLYPYAQCSCSQP